MTPIERFWAKVEKTDTCWLWTGYRSPDGYGQIGDYKHKRPTASGTKVAHRIAYELSVGPIPEGLQIDHLCRVRHCVRPEHLEAVTPRNNVLRTFPFRYGETDTKGLTRYCKNGHEMVPPNLIVRASGRRDCKACHRMYSRAYRLRVKSDA